MNSIGSYSNDRPFEQHSTTTRAHITTMNENVEVRRKQSDSSSHSSSRKQRRDAVSFLSNIPTSNSKKDESRKKRVKLSVDIPNSDQSKAVSTSAAATNSSSSSSTSSSSPSPQLPEEQTSTKLPADKGSSSSKKKLPHSLSTRISSKKSTALQFLQNIPLKKTPKRANTVHSINVSPNQQQKKSEVFTTGSTTTTSAPVSSERKAALSFLNSIPMSATATEGIGFKQQQEDSADDASSSEESGDPSRLPKQNSTTNNNNSSSRLVRVNKIEECFAHTNKDRFTKLPPNTGRSTGSSSAKRKYSTGSETTNAVKLVADTSSQLQGANSVNREDDCFTSETMEEDSDESNIRRCHLISKTSGMPILSCSYIMPTTSQPRKNLLASQAELSSTSNDRFQTNNNDTNDCNIGNLQPNTAGSFIEANTSPQMATPVVFVKNDRKYTSYEQWFNQSPSSGDQATADDSSTSNNSSINAAEEELYDPLFLDDPKIRSATNRTVMNLPGLISSTVPFMKKKELETDLNDQFREKHPNCQLSLSKIRSLKRKMLRVCFPPTPFVNALLFSSSTVQENSFIECSTVAMAVVYFEKLVLSNVVTKQNRKLVAATCLFLAFKMNYEGGGSNMDKNFEAFWDAIEENLSLNRKQVIKFEIQVFSWLDFNLGVAINELYPHLKRLLFEHGLNVSEYIGEKAFKQYISSKVSNNSNNNSFEQQ